MIYTPSDEVQGRKVIVDACILSADIKIEEESLNSFFYDKDPERLSILDSVRTREYIDFIRATASFIHRNNSIILPEVAQENWCFVDSMNLHYSFFSGKNKYAEKVREDSDLSESLRNLFALNNALFRLYKLVDSMKVEVDWTKEPANRLLHVARARSRDTVRKINERKSNFRSPNNIGVDLETDQKLAAYSFLSSYSEPTTLMTKDRGLISLVDRVNQVICTPNDSCYVSRHVRPKKSDLRIYNVFNGDDIKVERIVL